MSRSIPCVYCTATRAGLQPKAPAKREKQRDFLRTHAGYDIIYKMSICALLAVGDGAVTAVDAVLILRYLIGMIAALPV